jgi:hypothetical protein
MLSSGNVTAELYITENQRKIWILCLASFGLTVLWDDGPETFVWVNHKKFRVVHGTRPNQRFFKMER